MTDGQAQADGALTDLATLHGIDTGYYRFDGTWRPADPATLRTALRALGVAADDDEAVGAALARTRHLAATRAVAATTIRRSGKLEPLALRAAPAQIHDAALHLEGGGSAPLTCAPGPEEGTATAALPPDLPLGIHHLSVDTDEGAFEGTLIHAPATSPGLARTAPAWGWMLQLYAALSEDSWGIGDLGDLTQLVRWTAQRGGQFAVVNPLHAQAPIPPVQSSPYYPSSRRFHDPLMLRVGDVPEVAGLTGRAIDLARLQAEAHPDPTRIERNAVLAAKTTVLSAAFAAQTPERRAALEAYRLQRGAGLRDFATFCTIAEEHGLPFTAWPTALRHPEGHDVARYREAHAERVAYHAWLQMLCEEQLATAQQAARDGGMAIGVVHDLAIGVDPGGADAWALQDELGFGVTVGAPPDPFSQQGQNWGQPPLLPNRLETTGFAPLRDMLGGVLRHAGGVRIDHVMGLFRLFWIPDGAPAAEGTYVRYPAEASLAVLALEAERAGAVVIGEDLGTVEPGVRERLAEERILGSQVLYFERDEHGLRPPETYREQALASVNTHDLPTAVGWWTGSDVALRIDLGLLEDDTRAAHEWDRRDHERAEMHAHLRDVGLVGDDPALDDLVVAMHELLARTPSRLVALSLSDAVGDARQPNLPGTTDAYPNWRLPLAVPDDTHPEGHRPLTLGQALSHPLLARIIAAMGQRTARD